MRRKPIPPSRKPSLPPQPEPGTTVPKAGNGPVDNPLRQPDSRWQRTVRFNWDKGGSRGGRR